MPNLTRLLRQITLVLMALLTQSAFAQGTPLRIFHVMSFDSPWRWTDGQYAGFKEGLGDVNAEYRVFQMDIKRYASAEQKAERGRLAREMIETWKPDLVYLSDDAAIEHVAAHYAGSTTPFVFSGANETLEEHVRSCGTAPQWPAPSGRSAGIPQSSRGLQQIPPSAYLLFRTFLANIASISDFNRFMSPRM